MGKVTQWIDALAAASSRTIVKGISGGVYTLDEGVDQLRRDANYCVKSSGGRIILIGNGGSLAIAQHIATDFCLSGWPSIALCDPVAITSHTNDFGSNWNFSKQLELYRIDRGDILIAMSCSGNSQNIIDAVNHARHKCDVYTFTGMGIGNPIRKMGKLNFWVPSNHYGIVQLAHESILHAACDIEAGREP